MKYLLTIVLLAACSLSNGKPTLRSHQRQKTLGKWIANGTWYRFHVVVPRMLIAHDTAALELKRCKIQSLLMFWNLYSPQCA
jgi:hypothetical protein